MEAPKTPWFYHPLAVIGALLLLGPFAFPLLWKSSSFNRFWKTFWTVFILALTVYLVWATWKIVGYFLQAFNQMGLF